jgi:poly-beta-1,6-N-acetyl-D-glucosamine synthase
MEVFFVLVAASYLVLLLLLMAGWERAIAVRSRKGSHGIATGKISVIIPVRNEEQNIIRLLESLAIQNDDNYEIIIVDDHSSDNTTKLAQKFAAKNTIILKNSGHGKKTAITTGIRKSTGSIIACTDADCTLSVDWLNTIRASFSNRDVKFSFGPVIIQREKTFFSTLQTMEFASLIGTGAATASFGMPTMCNAANLAYLKNVFEEVNGFEGNTEIASGDDEFLMRKVKAKYPDGIIFDANTSRIVSTRPCPDGLTFLHQRLRWASKWKYNTSAGSVLFAVFVMLVQLSIIYLVVQTIIGNQEVVVALLVGKIMLEAIFLHRISIYLGIRWSWPAFIVLQIIYPVYALAIGILSNFLSFRWKGREKGLPAAV